ncbi:MAG: YitT family protein, partial [Firmicutes bacterium]|nr:YitT family protein [Bacillota bacterium]
MPYHPDRSEVGPRAYAWVVAALGRMGSWSWPPWRYFVGNAGVAAVLVWVERAAHISSGGVNGLSLALAPLLGWNLGLTNFLVKVLLFLVVWVGGGGWTAAWTVVSAALIGLFTAVFSRFPLPWHWPSWMAVGILLSIAYLPTGLVLSCG